MATISQMIEKFEAVDIATVVRTAVQDTEQEYADKNAEQLFTGVTAKGDYITPPYTRRTVREKQQKGQPADRVTLRDKGGFYRGLYVRVEGNNVVAGSTDPKADDLQDKYGADIFTIGGEFKREYVFGPLLLRVKQILQEMYRISV